jgi:uncharacterized protein
MKIAIQSLFLILLAVTTGNLAAEEPTPRTLATSGVGLVKAQPDSISIVMQATSTQKTASDAKREVDQRVNALLDQLKSLGIAKSNIVASGLRLNPQYDYNNRNRIFAGFSASRDISVNLEDLDKVNSVLESAVATGVDNINQLLPQNKNQEDFQQQAFKAAIADSKAKAATLAKAYGAELGAIYSISYLANQPIALPKAEMAAGLRMAQDSGGQYLHDEITYRDDIQVVFELIIPH